MVEKYGALWVDSLAEQEACVVELERYSRELEKLFVIYAHRDGTFSPYSYVKKGGGPQWSLPFWEPENEKAILASYAEASVYLSNYGLSNS